MARKFLYLFVVLIVLVIAGAFAYRFFGSDLMRFAMVPQEEFQRQPSVAERAYDDRSMWIARPDIARNPTLWTPSGYIPQAKVLPALFYIHPTSYLSRAHWNADLADQEANERANLFLRGQASAFNASAQIWAPRYRQATFGAFLTDAPDADRALDLAYGDVLAAFDAFMRQVGPDRPIILAGHSQGALHLAHLLRDRVAGTSLSKRVIAAYVVGWPISQSADLPAMGLPECTRADQSGCVLSWESFAEPADPSLIVDRYDKSIGFSGKPRRDTPIICTNPLTGTADASAPASANLGTLYPSEDLTTAQLVPGRIPARCGPHGLLLIGEPPDLGGYVLPGNNYHVYDYSLFWADVRADIARRVAAFPAP